jgi:L-threonylcarbamoyladenylate synthase
MKAISRETLESAAGLLCSGGVVVIPTDTVYGIAAHPECESAVERIRIIKGRRSDKPIALLAADRDAVMAFCGQLSAAADTLMRTFWPGALTLVLPCGDAFEGFRVPDHQPTCALIRACGGTLRVTSANLSGSMPALSAVEALRDVGLEADMVIDGGVSPGGVASTVVRADADNTVTILREGAITPQQIFAALPAPAI